MIVVGRIYSTDYFTFIEVKVDMICAKTGYIMSQERTVPTDVYVLQPTDASYGPNAPNDSATRKTWGDGQKWTVIKNVAEMVDEVKKKCGGKGFLRVLRIGGHGSTISFRLGETSISLTNIEMLDAWLKDIHPFVKPGRTLVQLDHCNVGHAETLMKRLAVLMGNVTVMGPVDSQYTNSGKPVYEGGKKFCRSDGKCRTSDIVEGTICTGKTCVKTYFANDDPRILVEYVRDWEVLSGASVTSPAGTRGFIDAAAIVELSCEAWERTMAVERLVLSHVQSCVSNSVRGND